jgi:hypothetical protein
MNRKQLPRRRLSSGKELPSRPSIRHDVSTTSIVTVCAECPSWFAFNFDRDRAGDAGVDHLIQCHGLDESDARAAEDERRRRRATRQTFVEGGNISA